MKLTMTLPERPGFLHAVPLFNLFALLLLFFLLGPSFVGQSGVAVELPLSRFQMDQHGDATVVTVTAGDPPGLWLDREEVTLGQLDARLDARRGSETSRTTAVLLQVDKDVPTEVQRQVAEIALHKGYRVYLMGTAAGATEPEPGN